MDNHSSRLVDDRDVFILVNQTQQDIFRVDACRRGGRNIYNDHRALLDLVRGLHRGTVDEDSSLVHKFLDAGAAYLGEFQGEKTIEARASLLGWDDKFNSLGHRVFSCLSVGHPRYWVLP